MKVISLNLWIGKKHPEILSFVKQHTDVDVFCFQEVISGGDSGVVLPKGAHARLFEEIASTLSGHVGFFAAAPSNSDFVKQLQSGGAHGGQAIFVRKDLSVLETGNFLLYEDKLFDGPVPGGITGNFDYVIIEKNGERFVIGNIHGLWQYHKDDTPERLEQSGRLLDFFRRYSGKRILCGDFNLRPTTQSIALLGAEMENLIANYQITNTRNAEYKDMELYKDYIADYAFVSPEIKVSDFKVLHDVVSDHAPLMLECE
jgi:endonuclease/exonuclease/phosphatase family metal-dependent hydrolase